MQTEEQEIDVETSRRQSAEESARIQLPLLWAGILLTYLLLFSVTGYIAFLQEPYNPAVNPNERIVKLLNDQYVRPQVLEALKQEGEAFKARRELAAQSFNVVLGAVLGFLSASAAHGIIRRRDTR
jgi:hypothetical protein